MPRPRGVDAPSGEREIRPMSCSISVALRVALASAVLGLAACERGKPPATRQPAAPAGGAAPSVAGTPESPPAWDPAAGPALLVRGGVFSTALVVLPQYTDSTLPDSLGAMGAIARGDTVLLVGRSGRDGEARVMRVRASEASGDCIEWPNVILEPTTDDRAALGWTVAFVGARVEAIPLDSIEGLASADSAQLAATITRLASSQRDDTSATFRGIPLVVRMAYWFAPAPHVRAVVADLVRDLNLEASPLQQRTLLIAERSDAPGARDRVVYLERTAGAEDSVVTSDVLGAVRLMQSGVVALVVGREGPDGTAYTLLERSPAGGWRVRWTSAHAGC